MRCTGLRCTRCRITQRKHTEVSEGVYHCQDGTLSPGFMPYQASPKRQSQSWDEDELLTLEAILDAILMGKKDFTQLRRRPAFARIANKVQGMSAKQKARRSGGSR